MSWETSGLRVFNPLNWYQMVWPQQEAVSTTSTMYAESSNGLLTAEEIELYSFQAFGCFCKVWDFDDFWKRANTCDACISLVDALMSRQYNNDVLLAEMSGTIQEMLEKNITYYRGTNLATKWVDDFGWWGLMSLNAFKLLQKLGRDELAKEYFNLAKESWDYLIKQGYDESPDAKPVAHGCRNCTAEAPKEGVKNTIVNALLLLLSTRLYRDSGAVGIDRKPFLEMAAKQWTWFSQWLDRKYGYFKDFDSNAALVNERPLDLDGGSDYQDTTHPDWPKDSKGWFWTGDHGLLIAALFDLLDLKDELTPFLNSGFEAQVLDTVQQLVRGVSQAMLGDEDVFYEPPCSTSYGSLYSGDYIGGRGILVRYMDVNRIKALMGIDFSTCINETAKALWDSRDETSNQFKADFTSMQHTQAYFNRFEKHVGFQDNVSIWNLSSSDPKFVAAAPQAVGLDFLAAAYKCRVEP